MAHRTKASLDQECALEFGQGFDYELDSEAFRSLPGVLPRA
jgi:hypothetical protein